MERYFVSKILLSKPFQRNRLYLTNFFSSSLIFSNAIYKPNVFRMFSRLLQFFYQIQRNSYHIFIIQLYASIYRTLSLLSIKMSINKTAMCFSAMSPALGMHPGMAPHLQQIQAHLLRSAVAAGLQAGHPAPPPPPPQAGPQHHPHMHVPGHTQLYPGMSPPHSGVPGTLPPAKTEQPPQQPESCRKDQAERVARVTAAEADTSTRRACPAKVKREPATTTTHHHHHHHPQNLSPSEDLRDEPGDFIETNCHWKECCQEFPTQVT